VRIPHHQPTDTVGVGIVRQGRGVRPAPPGGGGGGRRLRDATLIGVFAAEFGTGEVLWSLVWFSVLFILLWLVLVVILDICLGSADLSGWAKALWVAFIVFVPYLGVFVYLIARGHQLRVHAAEVRLARNVAPDSPLPDTRIEIP
jgi:hypothetical protein